MTRYAFLFVLLLPSIAVAHGGGLDANGGHHDRKRGGYHYHRPVSAPASTPAPHTVREEPTGREAPRVNYRTGARTEARTTDRRTELAEKYKPIDPIGWGELIERQKQEEERERLAQEERERLAQEKRERLVQEEQERNKRERAAASKFRIAKQFYQQGKPELCKKWLLETVAQYGETKAAVEARAVLERMGHNF